MSQAEQKANTKQKYIKIDAPIHFGDWHFEIRPALWPALGVSLREYVDKEKTKIAKEAAKKRGESDLSGISFRYLSHAVAEQPVFDFHEGDVFLSKKSDGVTLQVISQARTSKFIKSSSIQRRADLPTTSQTPNLRHGFAPAKCLPIQESAKARVIAKCSGTASRSRSEETVGLLRFLFG